MLAACLSVNAAPLVDDVKATIELFVAQGFPQASCNVTPLTTVNVTQNCQKAALVPPGSGDIYSTDLTFLLPGWQGKNPVLVQSLIPLSQCTSLELNNVGASS